MFSQISQIHRKTPMLKSGPWLAALLKRDCNTSVFSVKFVKNLKTPSLQKTSRRLLLKNFDLIR